MSFPLCYVIIAYDRMTDIRFIGQDTQKISKILGILLTLKAGLHLFPPSYYEKSQKLLYHSDIFEISCFSSEEKKLSVIAFKFLN